MLFTLMTWVTLTPDISRADYRIDVAVNTGGSNDEYVFFPGINVEEDGVPTNAFVTFASPSADFGRAEKGFSGFDNNPSGSIASSYGIPIIASGTADVLAEVNGTWGVVVEDDGRTFEYEADVELAIPFAELPYFTSSTLLDGGPAGPFSWTLNGGSAAYPGDSSRIIASLQTMAFGDIDRAILPGGTSSWSPLADFSSADQFRGNIVTLSEAVDPGAFRILAVRKLTDGAPDLAFGAATVRYSATLYATLEGVPVPEPAGLALALSLSGCAVTFRRAKR